MGKEKKHKLQILINAQGGDLVIGQAEISGREIKKLAKNEKNPVIKENVKQELKDKKIKVKI